MTSKPTAFIHFKEGDPWMRVFFPYDEVVVEVIKEILPSGTRWFDRPNGSWMVRPALLKTLVQLLEDTFDVHVEAPPEKPPVGDPIDGIFDLVPAEMRGRLYQRLVHVFHPDSGGSEALMKGLNTVWERYS